MFSNRAHRPLRFKLRTLLIAITVASLPLGWHVYQTKQQQMAVDWVISTGGNVRYDFEVKSNGYVYEHPMPPGPKWLRDLLGIDFLSHVHGVCVGPDADVTDLSPLQTLKHTRKLRLEGTSVTDISPIYRLSQIRHFELVNVPVNDLSGIAALSHLRFLLVSGTQVDELEPLAGVEALEWLMVASSSVRDIRPLASLRKLKQLRLFRMPIRDLSPLEQLKELNHLHLEDAAISSEEFESLKAKLPNCYSISFVDNKLGIYLP